MRIGIDIDDVLTNTVESFSHFCNKVFEEEVSYEEINDWGLENSFTNLKDSEGIRYAFKLFTHSGGFGNLDKVDNECIKYLRRLMIDGHELYFITARNSTAISDTYRWFDEHNLPIDNIYFDRDKQWQFRKHEIEVHIDDGLHNLAAAKECGVTTILFTQPWNKKKSKEVVDYEVTDWKAIYNLIEEMNNG